MLARFLNLSLACSVKPALPRSRAPSSLHSHHPSAGTRPTLHPTASFRPRLSLSLSLSLSLTHSHARTHTHTHTHTHPPSLSFSRRKPTESGAAVRRRLHTPPRAPESQAKYSPTRRQVDVPAQRTRATRVTASRGCLSTPSGSVVVYARGGAARPQPPGHG